MINKKAFTLTELIIIIIIIGVILIFALPNVTSTIERNKKDSMISDAKDFVEKTKNYLLLHSTDYPQTNGATKKLYLNNVDTREEIVDSPFGEKYDRDSSKVEVTLEINSGIKQYRYAVYLTDNYYELKANNISELNSDTKYELVKRK